MTPEKQEFISAQLDRLDQWEEHHRRRVERELRERVIVDAQGTATVEYREEDEYEREYRLMHESMKLCLLWESRYLSEWDDFFAFEYVHIVIDHRLGLRKTLRYRESLPKWVRCRIREQVDEIIAAQNDIREMTGETISA